MPRKRDPRLKRAGVRGYNIPKRTPGHRTKSHIVVAKVGNKIKTIRFGQQGAKTAGKPKKGESARMKAESLSKQDIEEISVRVKCQQHTGQIELSGRKII